jgi:hypothetical protein
VQGFFYFEAYGFVCHCATRANLVTTYFTKVEVDTMLTTMTNWNKQFWDIDTLGAN